MINIPPADRLSLQSLSECAFSRRTRTGSKAEGAPPVALIAEEIPPYVEKAKTSHRTSGPRTRVSSRTYPSAWSQDTTRFASEKRIDGVGATVSPGCASNAPTFGVPALGSPR